MLLVRDVDGLLSSEEGISHLLFDVLAQLLVVNLDSLLGRIALELKLKLYEREPSLLVDRNQIPLNYNCIDHVHKHEISSLLAQTNFIRRHVRRFGACEDELFDLDIHLLLLGVLELCVDVGVKHCLIQFRELVGDVGGDEF